MSVTLDSVDLDRFETICPTDEDTMYEELTDQDGISELFVLRTCERFECYIRDESLDPSHEVVFPSIGTRLDSTVGEVLPGDDAIEHLFRVACGLESNVLGENEILGQIRAARTKAIAVGALDGQLQTIVQKAIQVGRRGRSETAINEGMGSPGSVAVERIRNNVDDLADSVVLVVGAGELASAIIDELEKSDDCPHTTLVANRSPRAAEELADVVAGQTLALTNLPDQIPTADVIVTATTSSTPILTASDMQGTKAAVFDLGTPRDVDAAVASLDTVELTTLEEIFDHRSAEPSIRRTAIPTVEAMISEECSRLEEQLRMQAVDAVSRIRCRSEAVRQEEFDRALARFRAQNANLSPQQEAVLHDFSVTLVNELLHTPTVSLRQVVANGHDEALEQALRLFDTRSPGESTEGPNSVYSSATEDNTEHPRIGAESTSPGVS